MGGILDGLYGVSPYSSFFFFNDTATTEIYTLSLHDGSSDLRACGDGSHETACCFDDSGPGITRRPDRKSTRLNSSHGYISYAVFCLKKKNKEHLLYEVYELTNHFAELLSDKALVAFPARADL